MIKKHRGPVGGLDCSVSTQMWSNVTHLVLLGHPLKNSYVCQPQSNPNQFTISFWSEKIQHNIFPLYTNQTGHLKKYNNNNLFCH